MRIGLKLVAKSSSSSKFHLVPQHSTKGTVKSNLLLKKPHRQTSEQISKHNSSEAHLDCVNVFNPPKSNPNGRLASSRLFNKSTPPKPALAASQFRKTKIISFSPWRISAILIILLVNSLSALIILNNKTSNSITNQELEAEISAGKTDLTVQEFITPDLNSLSRISLTTQDKNPISKVSSPLAIPPTNLPSQGIINSHSYYYILAEYTGEPSLNLAQKQVKNVSLVNLPQGTFIYLGAFSDKDSAQNFVNKIKKEGLYGYIYPEER